jgi:hypothetical protein
MSALLFGLVAGSGLTWAFMELRRDGYWREFSTRHRGSNPPPPGRKPSYGWGPRQLNPPTPAPGMRREWLWSPSQMAECGGPCWEARDPRYCVCGALWRDVPIRMDESQTQRGNGNGGPTTSKLPIKPQPHGGYQPRPSNRTPNPPPAEP